MREAPTATSRKVIIVIPDNIAFAGDQEQKDILEKLFDSGTVVYGLTGKDEFHRVEIKISSAQKRKEKPVVLTKRDYYLRKHAS